MWRRWFGKRASEVELEEEFAAHLAIEARQLMERGMTREQAETVARRRFGNSGLLLEETRAVHGVAAFGRIWQDVRYTARVLRRAPAFTAAAVLSLALGMGAATAVFSIADTVFLRPLPYPGADRLMWVAIQFPGLGGEFVPSPDYVAWRRDNRVFENLAATQAGLSTVMLLDGPDPTQVRVARVSANFLETFGVKLDAGRTFRADEELPNGPKAVLLTYPFWRDHFHGRAAVGSVVPLDGQPYTVIGILPQSLVYPADVKIDLLTTLPVNPTASHRDRSMSTWAVFGRLKPGVTMVQARADLDTLLAASRADAPQFLRSDNHIVLQPLQEHRAGNVRTLLEILIGAAACLLAIACANVANLLLARWSARARELAVRAAIGAGRGRLARQLFAEIALLIAAGTAAALLMVEGALHAFVRFAAGELPRLSEVGVDFRVFGIALAVSIVTALLFGGLPALRAAQVDLQSVLQHAARGTTGGRQLLRRTLVGLEVALSVVLLTGAALLFQTLWRLQNERMGFQPEHLLTVTIPLRGTPFQGTGRTALADDILSNLRRMPGIEAAATTECSPLSGGSGGATFSRSDRPLPEPFHRGDGVGVCGAGTDYWKAAGERLVRGRFFTEDDRAHPGSLAVINEAAARTYFPGEDPLGKQILGSAPWRTIVGIVADTKNQGLTQPTGPEVWINGATPGASDDLRFLVRTLASEGAVARMLHAGHPELFHKVQSVDAEIAERTASPRFNSILLSSFAALAFLMAMVGVYGVLAFAVTQRSAEIGIRMALGATPERVLAMVMQEGAATVAAGTLVGVPGALLVTRALTSLLYEVKPTDPATYVAVVLGIAAAAAAASFLPARRASKLDLAIALRQE